ncbi:MAG TPA: zinc-binding dehydrogenase [Streptosporangiaceae bacterium]|nr:zinc-binding dehydrogenase [Streptosporangiaceae bacterium]
MVAERGAEGVEKVRELTGGDGAHAALECVGTGQAIEMALGVTRDGGVVGRVGAAQYSNVPMTSAP